MVTIANAILGYKEVFTTWKVSLTTEQEEKLKTVYFKQAWEKFAEDGILFVKDSWRFLKDMMTMPVIAKDPALQSIVQVSPAGQAQESIVQLGNSYPQPAWIP